jgi:hypothetical protein
MTEEIYEGHEILGNVFLAEEKDNPGIQPVLAESIFANSAKLFNFSIPALFALNDFILPFVGSFLLYLFFFYLLKDKLSANFFSFSFFLLFIFTFGRPINPQLSFILLLYGLIIIWKIFENFFDRKIDWILILSLGVDVGMIVYIYPYFWTTLFIVFSISSFIFFLKTKNFLIIKNYLLFLVIFGIICIPYIINLFEASFHPFYAETIARFGMLNNHWPAAYINVFLLSWALMIIILFRKKIDMQKYLFILALLISAILLNWQNVITGHYLQFSSHYYQISILMVFISISIIYVSIKKHFKVAKAIKQNEIIVLFLTIMLIMFVFSRQYGEIFNYLSESITKEQMAELQSYRPIFDWLNINTERDDVVLSLDEKIEGYLPIYTHNNLYAFGYMGYYLMSDDELEDRWVRQNLFNNNLNINYVKENNRGIWLNKFIDKYQNESIRNKLIVKLTGKKLPETILLPDVFAERVFNRYEEAKKEKIDVVLKKYRVDYILLNKQDEQADEFMVRIDNNEFIKPIVKIGNRVIYKVE